jgi:DNA-binding transcriptional LysR family regulator
MQHVLDPRRLRALHAVVTTGSVKEAAAQLGYSSSAISQHIATLQRETRSVLLEPAGRGVRATPAGELLAEHAARIFERLAQAEAELVALNAGSLGPCGSRPSPPPVPSSCHPPWHGSEHNSRASSLRCAPLSARTLWRCCAAD